MQVLILVPNIPDMNIVLIFLKKCFHVVIDVVHSQLTNSRYLKIWMRTKYGKNSIVIGTKKSIFLPFLKLGLIIVNQEHSLSYKSTNRCRYNSRDIGILRAYKEKIPIILDSDSPSLKTLYNIFRKKCFYVELTTYNRIFYKKYNIIDLKRERIQSGLTDTLINEVHHSLKKECQVLLLFNKFSISFLVLTCNTCQWVAKCYICRDYYEVNVYRNILLCKFCLIKVELPVFCHHCKSVNLIISDIGIKKIKNTIHNTFSNISILFLFNQKDIYNIKLLKTRIPKSCIILSTEKLVKHFNFSCVKLVSLINIDHYFSSFNFRSIEYFAQFYINLNQFFRKSTKSLKILIQTSYANNIYLKDLCNNGYFSFARSMLFIRKKFLLPPWQVQSIFYSESLNIYKNIIFLNLVRAILKKKSKKNNIFISLIGPHPCFLWNDKKHVFFKLLIQASSRVDLNNLLNESINIIRYFEISRTVNWFIDIDPY
jgi:primosomal protein N' (replication factor Y)